MTAAAIGDTLATVNASLNGTSALAILGGWLAIKSGRRRLHRALMIAAVVVSSLFLVGYLTRVGLTGTHRYPGGGAWRALYLTILGTHMLLAVVTPPLVLRALFLAVKQRFVEHRRLVRWAYPIWMYVSVTGVLVYVLLYHPPG
jgi:putative membrane protein